MNEPSAHERRSARSSGRRLSECSPPGGRPAPRLVVVLELEDSPRVELRSETREDELRLRTWLGSALTRRRLSGFVERILDELAREAA